MTGNQTYVRMRTATRESDGTSIIPAVFSQTMGFDGQAQVVGIPSKIQVGYCPIVGRPVAAVDTAAEGANLGVSVSGPQP